MTLHLLSLFDFTRRLLHPDQLPFHLPLYQLVLNQFQHLPTQTSYHLFVWSWHYITMHITCLTWTMLLTNSLHKFNISHTDNQSHTSSWVFIKSMLMNTSNLYCSKYTDTTDSSASTLCLWPIPLSLSLWNTSTTILNHYVRFWLYANSRRLMMAGSSLSSKEAMSWLATVIASERQSPSSSTLDEVQPPIAIWKMWKFGNGPIRPGDGQKMFLQHPCYVFALNLQKH